MRAWWMEFWEAEVQMVGYSLTVVAGLEMKVMVEAFHSDAVLRERESTRTKIPRAVDAELPIWLNLEYLIRVTFV